jgi:hypothetical protein
MKVQRMLGESTKSQDRGNPANRDGILCAICYPSDAGAVLVEKEGSVKQEDYFFIPIISKGHNLLEPMILTHLKDFFESWIVLLELLDESPIYPFHRNIQSLLALIDKPVPINMKEWAKMRIHVTEPPRGGVHRPGSA